MRMQKKLHRPRRRAVRLAPVELTPEQQDALRSIVRQAKPLKIALWPLALLFAPVVIAIVALVA